MIQETSRRPTKSVAIPSGPALPPNAPRCPSRPQVANCGYAHSPVVASIPDPCPPGRHALAAGILSRAWPDLPGGPGARSAGRAPERARRRRHPSIGPGPPQRHPGPSPAFRRPSGGDGSPGEPGAVDLLRGPGHRPAPHPRHGGHGAAAWHRRGSDHPADHRAVAAAAPSDPRGWAATGGGLAGRLLPRAHRQRRPGGSAGGAGAPRQRPAHPPLAVRGGPQHPHGSAVLRLPRRCVPGARPQRAPGAAWSHGGNRDSAAGGGGPAPAGRAGGRISGGGAGATPDRHPGALGTAAVAGGHLAGVCSLWAWPTPRRWRADGGVRRGGVPSQRARAQQPLPSPTPWHG